MTKINQIKQNIKNRDPKTVYYLVVFLQNLAMSMMVTSYVLFLYSKGLDPLQANLINAVFMIGNFFFEVPTGVYADYFGRKKSIMLFFLVWGIAHFIYFFSNSLQGFIIAELIAALGITFITGALDAWLVDSVSEGEYVGKVDYILSQAQVYGKTAFVLGGLIGGYLATINLAAPFLAEGFVSLFGLVFTLIFVKEDFIKPQAVNLKQGFIDTKNIVKDSLKFIVKEPTVKWLTIITMISWFAFQPLNMFWSPRFTNLGQVDTSVMGWAWVAFSLSLMLGSYLIKRFTQTKQSYQKMAYLTFILLGIPVIISGLLPIFLPSLTFFIIYELGRGMEKPFMSIYLNRYIPSDKRATLLSFNGMLGRFGAALGLIVFGFLGKAIGFSSTWIISGFLLLTIIPIFYLKFCLPASGWEL
ncbi:MAG: MFS transporter [Candidatus Beckwithbacteria bacterium]